MLFDELVAFRFFPFADIGRFLYVLPVDSLELEPNVLSVVVDVNAVVFRLPHVLTLVL